MTYGLGTSLFIENGPAVHAAKARARGALSRAWRALDHDRRLRLIDDALASTGSGPAAV